MPFDGYRSTEIEIDPIRKVVSGECIEDPWVLSDAVAQAVRELYHRADGEEARVLGWTARFERSPGSPYGEGLMTVAATDTTRKRRRVTAAQMEAEIMGLLSIRRDDA